MEVVKAEHEEKEETKDPDMVEFSNQVFMNFRVNLGIANIAQAKGWTSDEKFKISDFMLKISDSREIKAFDETVKYLKEAHDEAQIKEHPDDKEKREAFEGDGPKAVELLKADSGFSIKKLKLKVKVLPEGITPADLMMARWLIEIERSAGK